MSTLTTPDTRPEIHLGVFFQGVNFSTIWNAAESGSQTEFESFRRLAQTAERGLFDAFFLGEGLRLREHLGAIHALDVVGRPDAGIQLAALAAVTERIGLVATQNTTFHEPTALAHRLGTLDVLSGGRAAWNIVTTDNAWTGENFRRGGYLDHADRYTHAEFVVNTVKALWDSYQAEALADTTRAAAWSAPGAATPVTSADAYTAVSGVSRVPRSVQEHPVLFQAGDSPDGRDFAARNADVIFSAHSAFEKASDFAADIRRRTAAAGRPADDLKIFPGQEFILAETEEEARDKARWVRESQVTPQTALAFLEQTWGRSLGEYDPEGPLPDIPSAAEQTSETRGTGFHGHKAAEQIAAWRGLSEERGFSIRDLVIHLTSGRGFVGSYSGVADELVRYAEAGVVDGFNVTPYLVPSGLDDIVNGLVPELQERGIYPTEYRGDTLREHLGLRRPLTRRHLA